MRTIDTPMLTAWQDPVHDAQTVFRAVLQALSEPGTIHTLPVDLPVPAPLGKATTALCLTLLDMDTPVWIDYPSAEANAYLRFHCGCPLADDHLKASFAVLTDPATLLLDRFAQGSIAYPDRSATVIVQVMSLTEGPVRTLTGPGIATSTSLRVAGLPDDFNAQWASNHAAFPCGVDLIFCNGSQLVAVPRSTAINAITPESNPCM